MLFAEAQAVTAQANATNYYDKGTAKAPWDVSAKPMFLHGIVTTALTDGGSNTSTDVDYCDDDNTAGSSVAVLKTSIIQFAQAAAVGVHKTGVIPPGLTTQRYIFFRFTPNGANLTGGAFTLWVSSQREFRFNAPAAFTVASS